MLAKACEHRRQVMARKVGVALHLDGERRICKGAIDVDDGIPGVFPALVDEPFLGALFVAEIMVPTGIDRVAEPCARRTDRGKQLAHEGKVGSPFPIHGHEHEKQRRRIDAAVVGAIRQFPGT